MAGRIEGRADRPHLPVHHRGRCDHIRSSVGLRDRGTSKQVERRVVVDGAVVEQHATVAVVRVLTEAHVGYDEHVGKGLLHGRRRFLDDAVRVIRAGAESVLARRQAEQEHRTDAELFRFRWLPG